MKTKSFQAGAAQVKITPPLGTRINGDFITHYATYIHDDLYAKALVLQNGEITIAFIVVDICSMPKDFVDAVKRKITRLTAIAPSYTLIASTHTHAAGSVSDIHLGSADPAYTKKLPSLIVKSLVAAIENLQPAKIAFGSVDVPEHLLCRRYYMHDDYVPVNPVSGKNDQIKTNPFGVEKYIDRAVAPTDPQVSYLAVKALDDRWISLLGNYSLHYVGDWENGTISADYFGVFARKIGALLTADENFVGILSNGTSGDVNIWDFLDDERYPKANLEKSKVIGEDLANRVFESLAGITWQTDPQLSVLYKDLSIEVVRPTERELETAKEKISHAKFENVVLDQKGMEQIYAREQLLLNEFPASIKFPVQLIRIGDGIIGGLAGEFFSETGLFLKDNMKSKHYFTISIANGNVGYVPPLEEIKRGGYETWRCRYSCLIPGAEEMIREQLVALSLKLCV